jgi:tetratricopeptide (TPR) repeat protein
MSEQGPGSRREQGEVIVDAIASAVLHAEDEELAAQAKAAGEDIAEAAASLRAGFLARVEAARAREQGSPSDAVTVVGDEDSRVSGRGLGSGGDERDEEQAPPPTIGRYPILRRLGSGGMGVVYAAYDEILDRRLAIKVLHGHVWDIGGRRRERLLREAQAMARVTHPNVVTVHEVSTADDQLFVAMEFVAGPTLKEWLAAEPRPWREIVAIFCQIADGLAALHAAGLVHRDVKPANVIIGNDGRVRVLDLGLVGADPHEITDTVEARLESSSSHNRLNKVLTMTGERLGTPAYMSREQFMGLELTPASDIFSFCVCLYEALYGAHPFEATTFYELQASVVAGRIKPPPSSSSVPARIHALIVRGLASDPEHRPPSMKALRDELSRDPSRARRRFVGTFAIAVLAAVAGVFVTRAQTRAPSPSCDGAELAIAAVWSPERAREVREALVATDRPYAEALAERVGIALDDYARGWTEAHRSSCLGHARGDYSAALLDARMACLDRRRQAFAETVDILAEADAEVVEHAGQMVARLPRLEPCEALASLSESQPGAFDPRLAPALARFETRLVRAEALANAGRLDEAKTITREVAREAEALEQPALLVRTLLVEARAAILLRVHRASTGELLDRALELAIEQGLETLAAEAMIRRLYVRGLARGGSEAALADLPIAEAMLARAGEDPELHALLLNNAGAIHLAAGDRQGARRAFERSLELKERLYGEDHLELALSLANLGMLADEARTRRELHARMIAIYEERLGPDHPRTLDGRMLAAFYTADPRHAAAAYRELCPRFVEVDELEIAGACELERGRVEFARGRFEIAHESFAAARAHLGESPLSVVLDAYLALGREDPEPQLAALREQLAEFDEHEVGDNWWILLEQAERRVILAHHHAEFGDATSGVPLLERAIADLELIADQAQPVERERWLAESQAALALTLVAAGSQDRARIDGLIAAARRFYSQWPAGYARRLEQLDAIQVAPQP